MIDYFRDPAWQFVGALLALFALGATVAFYFLQQQKKRISYNVASRNQLLTVREELENKLQVLYDGQPTRDICLLVVQLLNSGNVPVSAHDFQKPLVIGTGPASKILSAAVTAVEPDNLEVTLTIKDSGVELAPLLLNPRDSINIKLLVSDFAGRLTVDGRVHGVRKIHNASGPSRSEALLVFVSVIFVAIGFYLLIHFDPKPQVSPPTPWQVKLGGVLVALAYIGVVYPSLKSGRFVKAMRWLVARLGS